ncbi:methyltransferase dimerization domain-containing protein, partial [Streptomyces sp. MCAF7]
MSDVNGGTDVASSDPAADAAAVFDLLIGLVRAQVLRGLAALRIADHLSDGAMTAEEVAEREGSHPQATYRLMRAASSMGMLSHEGDHRFGLTGRGQLLRSEVPGSM